MDTKKLKGKGLLYLLWNVSRAFSSYLAATRLAVVGGLVFPVLLVQSDTPSSRNDAYVDALWVAESAHLQKLATGDGHTILHISSSHRRITIDPKRHVIWGYTQGRLDRLDFSGQVLSLLIVDDEQTENAVLAVDAADGSAWLGVGKTLHHISALTETHTAQPLAEKIVGVAVDDSNQWIWIATRRKLTARDPAGQEVIEITLEDTATLSALAIEPRTGVVWIATETAVRGYSTSGAPVAEYAIADVEHLAVTRDGNVWAASKKELSRIDTRAGVIAYRLFPFSGQGTIDTLELSARSDNVWVAQTTMIRQFDPAGTMTREFVVSHPVRDLAVYADIDPPSLDFVAPEYGGYVAEPQPIFELNVVDDAIGFDPGTLKLELDGVPLEVSCEFGQQNAACKPVAPIVDGHVDVSAVIADHAGNVSDPISVNFTIDTVVPEITVTTPSDGTLTNQKILTVTGSLSESAKVSVNGQFALVNVQNQFQHGPVTLREGANEFSIVATDSAGNAGRVSVKVTLDTAPPVVTPPPDIALEATGPMTYVALGSAGAFDALSGTLQPYPDEIGPFPVGRRTVTWAAKDQAGNIGTATQFVTVVDTTPPAVVAPEALVIEATAELTAVSLGGASAIDLVDSTLTPIADPSGPFPLGTHEVVWTVTDAAGNTGSAVQSISIRDTTPPVLTLPENVIVTSDTEPAAVDIGNAQATDLFGPVTISNNAPSLFPAGETTVLWSAIDANGNQATAAQTVTVNVISSVGGWSEAMLLEHRDEPAISSTRYGPPVVKVDSAGRALAVWQQKTTDTGPWDAYASYFVNNRWSEPVLIENFDGDVYELDLALGPNGGATAVGMIYDSTGGNVWTARFDPSAGWQPAVMIGSGTNTAKVARDGDGKTYAVWTRDGTIWFSQGDSNDVWTVPEQVSLLQDEADFHDDGRITVDALGNVTVVWLNYGYMMTIQATRKAQAGEWEPVRVFNQSADWIYDHQIDSNDVGDVFVIWSQSDFDLHPEAPEKIKTARFSPADGWENVRQLGAGSPATYDTHIAVNGGGYAVAAWMRQSGNNSDVLLAQYAPGEGWMSPAVLTDTPDGIESAPRVAIDAKGNLAAVWWAEKTGSFYSNEFQLIGAGFDTEHGWSEPKQISQGVPSYAGNYPSLSINGSGRGFVVWAQRRDSLPYHDVWVSRDGTLAASGAPVVYPPPDLRLEATDTLTPVALGDASAYDASGNVLPAVAEPSGPFGIGKHVVTWRAVDSAGRSNTAYQVVTITDTVAPTLIPAADIEVEVPAPAQIDLGQPFVVDVGGVASVHNDAPELFPQGLTVVTWTATDNGGHVATATQRVAVGISFELTIDAPAAGESIDERVAIVEGTITGPINTGVTVNGIPATIFGGPYGARYFAEVELHAGANTIFVIATTPDGRRVNSQIDITATGQSPVVVDILQPSTIAPSLVAIEVTGTVAAEIAKVEVDFDGDGAFDHETTSTEDNYRYPYHAPGIYPVTIKVTFNDGSEAYVNRTVVVQDGADVDALFETIWNNMNRALVNGDKDTAMQSLTISAQAKYGPVIDVLLPHMPEIVQSYSLLQRVSVSSETGEYAINRWINGVDRIFLIYFIKGRANTWQLTAM